MYLQKLQFPFPTGLPSDTVLFSNDFFTVWMFTVPLVSGLALRMALVFEKAYWVTTASWNSLFLFLSWCKQKT